MCNGYGIVVDQQQSAQNRLSEERKKSTMVGSKYGAGVSGGIVCDAYAGEVGTLIGWNDDEVGICGENGGLGCG